MADDSNKSGLSSVFPVIGSALDFGSSLVGGLFNANQAKKNRQFQERMYERQVQDAKDMWLMQARWDLPSAQVQRLKDAKLNPLLMYGEGGASAMVGSQPHLPSAGSGAQGSMSAHTNFGQAMAQSALLQAQIRNIDADTAQKEATTQGQSNQNWLFDQTKNVEVALRFGDYDYVKQMIAESANRVFQSSFVNANEMASLSLQNSLAIRKQNLNEYEVGQNVLQGWQAVLSGRISANAQMKSAFAAMMHATNEAKLVPYQIGVMRATAYRLNQEGNWLKGSYNDRLIGLRQQNNFLRKQISWSDVLNQSHISEQQSRVFLNEIHKNYMETQNNWYDVNTLISPFNMLTGFGAGMVTNGAFKSMGKIGFIK